MPDLSPTKIKPTVVILWGDCYVEAQALKAKLVDNFKDTGAFFFDILDEATDPEYSRKSEEAIAKANRVLVLVQASVWKSKEGLNVRREVNLVDKRIRHGDLAESALSFVRVQNWEIPDLFSGGRPLSFASTTSLTPSEVTAFNQWLFQDCKKLPRIIPCNYERPDFDLVSTRYN
jgi:hypothetical protein